MLNGLRHGNGTYTCPERGLCYSGQWHKGKRHGEVRVAGFNFRYEM